jgi:4a-hydroxytetrahydrobiopterin dehydratase
MLDGAMAPRSPRLSDDEVRRRIGTMPGWDVENGALERELRFASFAEAFGFMASAALIAERMDHHPDWSNSYDRVTIRLSSHDANGITERDFALAEAMDRLLANRLSAPE